MKPSGLVGGPCLVHAVHVAPVSALNAQGVNQPAPPELHTWGAEAGGFLDGSMAF